MKHHRALSVANSRDVFLFQGFRIQIKYQVWVWKETLQVYGFSETTPGGIGRWQFSTKREWEVQLQDRHNPITSRVQKANETESKKALGRSQTNKSGGKEDNRKEKWK